jgi:hypothetical protein|tara:strand:- start:1261 stop:1575 length:315 start_codon:yes stop_codon:yes gene_type:complete
MNLRELIADPVIESLDETFDLDEKQIWGRKGNKAVRKYRCSGGIRHGRIVSSPSACFKPINMKARFTLKRTQARMGKRIARKSKRTKRMNPVSRRIKAMNKARR